MIYATVSRRLSKHIEGLEHILDSMARDVGGKQTGSGAGMPARDLNFVFASDVSAHRFKKQAETLAAPARPLYGRPQVGFYPHHVLEDLGQLQKRAVGRHQLVLVELPDGHESDKQFRTRHIAIETAGRYASMNLIGQIAEETDTLALKANSQDAELYVQALASALPSVKVAVIDSGPLKTAKAR